VFTNFPPLGFGGIMACAISDLTGAEVLGDLWRFRASELDTWLRTGLNSKPPLVPLQENTLFTRTRYQNGSLRVKKRGNGLKVWEFRYYEPLPEGNGRALRAVTVGTLQEYPTEAAVRKSDAVQSIILRLNAEHTLGPVTASTVGALIARYEEEELPARYSTRASYQSYLDNYIRPRWGEAAIASVKAMAVEDWLKRLTLAPKTRGHIRSLMSTLFKCAQRW
jgi:integrase